MAKTAMGHGSDQRGGPTIRSHHRGVKHPAAHQSSVRKLTRDRKTSVKALKRISKAGAPMRDAKGHGSDPRGGQKVAAAYRASHPPAAHQSGVMDALGKYGPMVAKNAAKIYVAQAAAGAAVGFAYPFLRLAGWVP